MPSAPMKIGMYLFPRMMTSKSTPVVVTMSAERVTVASAGEVVLDAPPAEVRVKPSKLSGALTLTGPGQKALVAALGSNSAGAFTAEQTAEVESAQQAAAQDPGLERLELARTLWIGRPVSADGSYQGALRSLADGDAGNQRRIGGMVKDALTALGARTA